MTARDDSAFLDRVAERARIPVADAEGLVRDFMKALSAVVDREAWSLVRGLIPDEIEVSWDDGAENQESSLEQFLLEVSQREPAEEGRAADHARAVGMAIREEATGPELERLMSMIRDEDVLALFEEDRGDLTHPDSPTQGEKALRSPPDAEQAERRSRA